MYIEDIFFLSKLSFMSTKYVTQIVTNGLNQAYTHFSFQINIEYINIVVIIKDKIGQN